MDTVLVLGRCVTRPGIGRIIQVSGTQPIKAKVNCCEVILDLLDYANYYIVTFLQRSALFEEVEFFLPYF